MSRATHALICIGIALSAAGLCPTAVEAANGISPERCEVADYTDRPLGEAETIHDRPPNPNGPTRVRVGFEAIDISDIVPIKSTFEYRGYVHTSWCDPRLRFEGLEPRIYTGLNIETELGPIWFAQAYPSNKRGDVHVSERVLRIYPDGTVVQGLNIAVLLATHYDLRDFPFDEQILSLEVESYVWDRDSVVMVVDDGMAGGAANLELTEWTVESIEARVDEVDRTRGDTPYSRYTMHMKIARNPGFYLWKVFLPLFIIVALSWSVFWMTEEKLASRSRITATGILTIVAYQFVFAVDMPRIGYLTILDKVMIWSFGLLAVTVLESMLVTHWHDIAPLTAKRIDRTSRWLFPCVYAGIIAILIAG